MNKCVQIIFTKRISIHNKDNNRHDEERYPFSRRLSDYHPPINWCCSQRIQYEQSLNPLLNWYHINGVCKNIFVIWTIGKILLISIPGRNRSKSPKIKDTKPMVLHVNRNMAKWYPYLVINHNVIVIDRIVIDLKALDAPALWSILGALYKVDISFSCSWGLMTAHLAVMYKSHRNAASRIIATNIK